TPNDQFPDPSVTGSATVTDQCYPGLVPTYSDKLIQSTTVDNYTVQRTWTVTDPCGQSSQCIQQIFFTGNAPTCLTATPASGQVTVGWKADAGSTGYNVKRSSAAVGPFVTVASGVTATSYADKNLVNGSIYYYKVSAIRGGVETSDSAVVCGIPSAPLPSPW